MEKKMSDKVHIPDESYVPANHPWAGSGNYVADDDTFPSEVSFANGRIVRLNKGADEHAYLIVEQKE